MNLDPLSLSRIESVPQKPMKMTEKRKRAANFSELEGDLLADLVTKYKYIIENKRTDGMTIKMKDETWKKIAKEFNSVQGVIIRNARSLKIFYENIKRRVRKHHADEKLNEIRAGSICTKPKLSGTTEKILALIDTKITPLPNKYDSDAVYHGDISEDKNISINDRIMEKTTPMCISERTSSELETSAEEPSVSYTESDVSTSPQFLNQELSQPESSRVLKSSVSVEPVLETSETDVESVQNTRKCLVSHSCEKKITLLEQEVKIMKEEHEKEMLIKELKIRVLREKLKYWEKLNKGSSCT